MERHHVRFHLGTFLNFAVHSVPDTGTFGKEWKPPEHGILFLAELKCATWFRRKFCSELLRQLFRRGFRIFIFISRYMGPHLRVDPGSVFSISTFELAPRDFVGFWIRGIFCINS